MTADPVNIVQSPVPLDDVRETAEGKMAGDLNPVFAASDWGQRMIQQAGENAVRREYERRFRVR